MMYNIVRTKCDSVVHNVMRVFAYWVSVVDATALLLTLTAALV